MAEAGDHQPGADPDGGTADEERTSRLSPREAVNPDKGHWPPWSAKFLNDFRSAKNAQENDGLIAPIFPSPDWADAPGASSAAILDAARRRHDQALDRSEKAEARAQRIVQTGLTLLALSFIVVGFEANRLRSADAPLWAWIAVLVLDGATIGMLALAIVQAISVDRVGFFHPANPGKAAQHKDDAAMRRDLALQEELAASMANWTGGKKVNEFLQARAWLTRAISFLALSGAVACLVWLLTAPAPPEPVQVQVTVGFRPSSGPTVAPSTTTTTGVTTSTARPPANSSTTTP